MGKAALTNEGLKSRLSKLIGAKNYTSRNVTRLHVKIQPGNSKTGPNCWTVSLLPVIDCCNCEKCKNNCYDLKSDCYKDTVINDRARNSAIHELDPARYWKEIDEQVKENFVRELRINVGGDLTDEDFAYVAKLGRDNKNTMILFFTKNYKGINEYLDRHRFPKNVRPILSAWEGLEMNNPHNLPEAHVLYEDGRTTAPNYGAYLCTGNCSRCSFKGEGCWTLKKGQHVAFPVH